MLNASEPLTSILSPMIEPLGFEVIHVETQLGRTGILRVFIDHLDTSKGGIGIEDCAKASRALDEALESNPTIEAIFKGPYELEVSSPGVERPLRRPQDFERFSGHPVRITVVRPLTVDEVGNPQFHQRFPKQKVFQGILRGNYGEGAEIEIGVGRAVLKKGQKPGKRAKEEAAKVERIHIPFVVISKAQLEPEFESE